MVLSLPLTDPWHYPRPDLAQRYLQAFQVGLTPARGVFAKRRMGKSEFLEQDLIPAARSAGYLTVYLNLRDARGQPMPALMGALSRALEPRGLAEYPGPQLSELLRGFNDPTRRMLLVLDEAQVLADPAHRELAHSLRAGLDSRKQTIKVLFAGSSEPTLRRMFGRPTQPFYNWAALEPFELLGDAFVEAMVAKVNQLSRYPLGEADARQAFAVLQETPEFFRRYLNRYLTYAELGAPAALSETVACVFNDTHFQEAYARLLPADREIMKLLAGGVTNMHSEAVRSRLGNALGIGKAVSNNTSQQSLRRLQNEDLVVKVDYGDYRVQDEAFAEWLRNQDRNTP
jgi:hypothetical protein